MRNILAFIGGAAVIFAIGFLNGTRWCEDRHAAEYARQVARLEAANKATEIDRDRLAGELQVSEAQIDTWKKEYQDALAKRTEVVCLLSDDDVRSLQYNPRPSR